MNYLLSAGVMLIPDYLMRITATLNSYYVFRDDQVINAIEPAHKSKSPGSGLKKNRPETGGVVD